MNDCKHVTKEQWDEIVRSHNFSDKTQSLLFVDKFNVKPLYVPSFDFIYGYEYNEFNQTHRLHLTDDEFDKWFDKNVREKTQFLKIHVCNPHEILRKLVAKCINLRRISFHYFILNTECIQFLVKCCPNLEVVNFENSIGIHLKGCEILGKLQNLKHLNLMGCDIYEDSLYVLLKNCNTLESLNICDNPGIKGRCLVSVNPFIKRLDLRDCWRIESQPIIEMARLKLNSLVELLANSGIDDQSLTEICSHCPNIIHLNISFDDFTFNDTYGRKVLSTPGFSSIGKLEKLQILTLRHVGRLTDIGLQNIMKGCAKLTNLTVNVRHRHKLTDIAFTSVGDYCENLKYLESVHNHFIGKLCVISISQIPSLKELILRGNQFVDNGVKKVIKECEKLIHINLDGCDVGEPVLKACIGRAQELHDKKIIFKASLIRTNINRSAVNAKELPSNLRLRVSGPNNIIHFAEFDGKQLLNGLLKDKFYPYYWKDFN